MKKIILFTLCTAGLALAINGQLLYETKCTSCHGKYGNLKPLGKNKDISKMNEATVLRKLTKMKNESSLLYVFKAKKRLMKDIAESLSTQEIKILSKYVNNL